MPFLDITSIIAQSSLSSTVMNTSLTEIDQFFNGTVVNANILVSGSIEGVLLTDGTVTISSGNIVGVSSITVSTVNVTTLDLGTNTILDGNMSGDWDFNGGNISAIGTIGAGDITSTGTVQGTTLTGTLSTANQTNITSLGTLTSLVIDGDLTVDTNTLKVDSLNSRVGIGTLSPETVLHIEGGKTKTNLNTTQTEFTADQQFLINNEDITPSTLHRAIIGFQMKTTTGVLNDSGAIGSVKEQEWTGVAATQDSALSFHTILNGVMSEKMRISSDGILQFGSHTAIGIETITGFITIKDLGGTTRKLAVVS